MSPFSKTSPEPVVTVLLSVTKVFQFVSQSACVNALAAVSVKPASVIAPLSLPDISIDVTKVRP